MSYPDNQQQQNKPFPKTALDIPKLGLRTRNRSGDFARLLFGLFKSKPTITLFTGNRDEDRKGIVRATLDLDNYGALLQVISEAILFVPTEAEPEYKRSMQLSRRQNQNGRNVSVPDARVAVGRDKEGVIYIAVIKDGHEDIRFDWKADDSVRWFKGRGEELPKGEVSAIYCSGWLKNIMEMMPLQLLKDFDEEHLASNAPNRNGGYQNNNGRSGNYGRQNGGNYDRDGGRSNQGTGGGRSYDNGGDAAPAKPSIDIENDLPF